jgi:hypothetical protein
MAVIQQHSYGENMMMPMAMRTPRGASSMLSVR